jgi:hypothetical protein
MHWAPEIEHLHKSQPVRSHITFLLLQQLFVKLLQQHNSGAVPWCHCDQLCCHPWSRSAVPDPHCLSHFFSYAWNLDSLRSPSATCNPPTAKDLKRIPPKLLSLACCSSNWSTLLSTSPWDYRSLQWAVRLDCESMVHCHHHKGKNRRKRIEGLGPHGWWPVRTQSLTYVCASPRASLFS